MKFIDKFNKDLKKYNDQRINSSRNNSYKDLLLIFITIALISFEIHSPFKFFYSNYILYSLIIVVLLLFLMLYWLPKKFSSKYFSGWYSSMIPITIIYISIWFIPRVLHYLIIPSKTQCIQSTLIDKLYNDYGESGFIKFDAINAVPRIKNMMFIDSFYGLDKDQYNNLPKKGEKIRICGEISKIGFSFDTVEAVRDENVSIEP